MNGGLTIEDILRVVRWQRRHVGGEQTHCFYLRGVYPWWKWCTSNRIWAGRWWEHQRSENPV